MASKVKVHAAEAVVVVTVLALGAVYGTRRYLRWSRTH